MPVINNTRHRHCVLILHSHRHDDAAALIFSQRFQLTERFMPYIR